MNELLLSERSVQLLGNLVVMVFTAGTLVVFYRLLQRLRAEGGRVATQHITLPDLLIGIFIALLLLGGALTQLYYTLQEPAAEKPTLENVSPLQMLRGSGVLLLMVAGLFGFAKFRGAPLRAFWGAYGPGLPLVPQVLRRRRQVQPPAPAVIEGVLEGEETPPMPPPRMASLAEPAPLSAVSRGVRIIGAAAGFLLLLVPSLVLLTNLFVRLLPKNSTAEQDVVSLFRRELAEGRMVNIGIMVLAAVVLAPLLEESLFRGYLYPTFKRYLGAWVAAPLMALLFALVHANLVSSLGLFVLALCLTLAFEWSGSLWVPIFMHGLFNALQLAALYLASQGVS